MSATVLRLRIAGSLKKADLVAASRAITQNTIYSYSTILALSKAIAGYIADPNATATEDHPALIKSLIEKYSAGLAVPLPSVSAPAKEKVVLLTGSTGNLGSDILVSLLREKSVVKIYVFNRPGDAKKRQEERFVDKGLDPSLLTREGGKIVWLEGDLGSGIVALHDQVSSSLINCH